MAWNTRGGGRSAGGGGLVGTVREHPFAHAQCELLKCSDRIFRFEDLAADDQILDAETHGVGGSARALLTRLGRAGVTARHDQLDPGEGGAQSLDFVDRTDGVVEPRPHRRTDAVEHEDVDRLDVGADFRERVAAVLLLVGGENADRGEARARPDRGSGGLSVAHSVQADLGVDGDDVVPVASGTLTGLDHGVRRIRELAVEKAPHLVTWTDPLGRLEGAGAAVEELRDDRNGPDLVAAHDVAEGTTEALDRAHVLGVEGEEDTRVRMSEFFFCKSFVRGHSPSFCISHRRRVGDESRFIMAKYSFQEMKREQIALFSYLVRIFIQSLSQLCHSFVCRQSPLRVQYSSSTFASMLLEDLF